ncbi:hypothetical protein GIB67_013326 [Kingdonia uniflora]|uniref:Uncharacterized protein n=1 Tax=Kingdonia uniflora TaxID=39325 RepID=A0A7J7LQN7_9MAGN|nr:hypothetical protein GIB67_013326 [Kingdonia uniflora]
MGVNCETTLTTANMSCKYAIVTGANKGIGFEVVRQLASKGVTVILTARNEMRGIAAVSSLVESGLTNVVFHQLDVCDPASLECLAKFVKSQFGTLDILVNNAGVSGVVVDVEGIRALNIDPLSGEAANIVQGVIQQTYRNAEVCIDTNYYGVKRVTEALLPFLRLSPSGARIVNVSSLRSELKRIPNEETRKELGRIKTLTEAKIDGIVERFFCDLKQGKLEANGWSIMFPAYSISKASLNAYTRVLAKTYPKMYINCVHPGSVNTDVNWHTNAMSVKEGARGPVMLALLPDGGPSGSYFDQTNLAEF